MSVVIRKVKEEHGCWGNMAPYAVVYNDKTYRTTEALFQALRFDDESIRSFIREQTSPMTAKMIAKKYRDKMSVVPQSERDLDNMRMCLRLKVDQHPELKKALIDSGEAFIVEDCTKRQRGSGLFWGAALQSDGSWKGENWLGKLWMELREKLLWEEIARITPPYEELIAIAKDHPPPEAWYEEPSQLPPES